MEINRRVAYFSMEIGIDQKIPSYSGGLGVLAGEGDTMRSFADFEIPTVGVTLLYRKELLYQNLGKDGWQRESPCTREPEMYLELLTK